MNYENIILELLSRVQELEKTMATVQQKLTEDTNVAENPETENKGLMDKIREYIDNAKSNAVALDAKSIVLRAGDIHKSLSLQNRIPPVCNAMKQKMKEGDKIIFSPPSGFSTTLEIEYFLLNENANGINAIVLSDDEKEIKNELVAMLLNKPDSLKKSDSSTITYTELTEHVNNKYGRSYNMSYTKDRKHIGDMLGKISDRCMRVCRYPLISAVVVNKAGTDRGLPTVDGFAGIPCICDEMSKLNRTEKIERIKQEMIKVKNQKCWDLL